MSDRICFVDCQKEPPECRCRASGMLMGVDLSNGVVTHVEAYYKGGVLHVTDIYEIVDGTTRAREASSE